MNKWLDKSDFEGRIKLPRAFELSSLDDFINRVVENWLPDLIGPAAMTDLLILLKTKPLGGQPDAELTYPADLYALVRVFLIYAVWADYVLFGNTSASETGLVVKKNNDFELLSDRHRAETHRYYKEIADQKARLLQAFVRPVADCTMANPPGSVRISAASGRTGRVQL